MSVSANYHQNSDPGSVRVYSLMLMFCWVYKVIYPLGMVMRLTIEGAYTMTGTWVRVLL